MPKISISDYNADWAYAGTYQTPRTHPGYLTREDVVKFYGGLGVDGVEYTHTYWADCTASYARQVAADAGLPVVCYVFGVDLAKPASSVQEEIDQARRMLDRTAELGARLAMLTPCVIKDGVPLSEQRQWMIDGLRACAEHAVRLGITACIENLDYPPGRPLTGSGVQCRDVCAAVASPGLRLIYDCGAPLFVDEEPLAALRAMRPYVAHVHVKNSRPVAPGEDCPRYLDSDGGRRYTGTTLDAGAVDVASIISELGRTGYEGYYLIEYQGMDDPRPAVERNVAFLRRIM
jgi:hydroxypyruvate isomerase